MAGGHDWTLTLRVGPRVERERFAELGDAVAEMQKRIEAVKAEGPLGSAKMFREYEPGRRIHARGEISRGRFLSSRGAGIDLMGDGALVPYSGTVWRKPLEPAEGETPFEAVEAFLRGAGK